MASGGKGSKDVKVVIGTGDKHSTRRFIRPVERQRMRPWLIEHLDKNDIPGLSWQNPSARTFKISWKHAANQGFSMEKDTNLFERWAIHTGRHYDSDHKRWKANFRCALNSLPDVSEMKEQGIKKGSNAFKVYKFLSEKETKTVKASFKKKKAVYSVVHAKPDPGSEDEGVAVKFRFQESDDGDESEGDHNYAEYKLRLGHLQSGSAVRPHNPSLPLLDELAIPTGVDLLLQAGSSESRIGEPLSGSPGFSSLRQILRAATESYSSKQSKGLSEESRKEAISQHMSQLYAASQQKLVERQEGSDHGEKPVATCVYKCIWCEKVCATKVELFQHYLIDHQDNLMASASEANTSKDGKPDPKLQREIADLEKSVLGNYKPQTETVIEDGEVLDLSINNDLSNKDMYIEEKALDLTVKKMPTRNRSEGLLDLSGYETMTKRSLRQASKDSGKGKGGKSQKGGKSSKKSSKDSELQENMDISEQGGGDGEDDTDDDSDDDDDDCGSSTGSHGDMSRQHSREDFLHAEMLLSLKSCVGSRGTSREGSPELGKRRKGQKRKRGSKESYEGSKQSKNDPYMKNLDKIIRQVDRRISKSDKVIVESLENEVRAETGKASDKKWQVQLQEADLTQGIPEVAKEAAQAEKEMQDFNKEASKQLKAVRGITKAITEAQKDSAKLENLTEETKLNEDEEMHEKQDTETEKKEGRKEDKPDLESLLKASMISSPFRCVLCGLRYSLKEGLLAHLKTHCDYLPFKCGICGLTFEKASFLLRNHLKTHMHNHKYICNKCGATFNIPLQLIQHLATHERKEETTESDSVEDIRTPYLSPFVCNLCDTSVSYGQELNTHVRRHFQEQIVKRDKVIIPQVRVKRLKEKLAEKDQTTSELKLKATAKELIETGVTSTQEAKDPTDSNGKPSILAKALQSAPKYGSNLVMDKATGIIYHISNLPETVKDFQPLSILGETQTENQDKLQTGKSTKEPFDFSQVVHVPVSNDSGSCPILIRKPSVSRKTVKTILQEKNLSAEQESENKVALPRQPDSKDNATSDSMAKFPGQEGKAGTPEGENTSRSHSLVEGSKSEPVQANAKQVIQIPTPTFNQEQLDQIPAANVSQLNQQPQEDHGNEHPKTTNDQPDKETTCIVQIAQGGVTQLVKIALPQSVLSSVVNTSQPTVNSAADSSSQVQQGSLTQSIPLAVSQLLQGSTKLANTSLIQSTHNTLPIVQGLSTQPASVFTNTIQGPVIQVLPDRISQVSQPLIVKPPVETINKPLIGTQQESVILNKPAQRVISPIVPSVVTSSHLQAISNPILQRPGSQGEQKVITQPIAANIGIPCMLPTVSLPKENSLKSVSTVICNSTVNQSISSPVLGNSPIILAGQGLSGIGTPIAKPNTSYGGLVHITANSTTLSNTPQFVLPLNAFGLPAATHKINMQEVQLSGKSNHLAPQITTAPPPVMLNVKIGNHSTRTAEVWPGSTITSKQSTHTSQTSNLVTSSFLFKSPECSQQITTQSNNSIASVVDKQTIPVSSLAAASSLTAKSSSSPQFLIKVPGLGDVIYTPTQTPSPSQSESPITDNSKQGISKLIENSLKTVISKANTLESTQTLVESKGQVLQRFPVSSTSSASDLTQTVSVLGSKIPVSSTVVSSALFSSTPTSTLPPPNAQACVAVGGGFPSSAAGLIANPVLSNIQLPSTSVSPQVVISSGSSSSQFSLPLIIKTSTGGGIATVQVGDKMYPLSLVFSQTLESTQADTSTISIATTSLKQSTSTVSVLTTSTASELSVTSAKTSDSVKDTTNSAICKESGLDVVSPISSGSIVMYERNQTVLDRPEISQYAISETFLDTQSTSKPLDICSGDVLARASPQATQVCATSGESIPISTLSTLASYINAHLSSLPVITSSEEITTSTSTSLSTASPTSPSTTASPLSDSSFQTLVKEDVLWLCSICSCFFPTSKALSQHMTAHKASKEHIFRCEHCEALFYDANQMRQHNLTHFLRVNKDSGIYKCPRCDVEFTHGDQLKYHCAWAHKDDTYPCEHCDQVFLQDVALVAHSFHHPYQCKICQKRFDSRNAVQSHLTHPCHDKSSNVCTFCKESFKAESDLKEHLVKCPKMKISAKYIWLCEACSMPFTCKKKLVDHIPTHFSKTVCFCGVCRQAFLDTKGAQTHMLVHTSSCEQCGELFANSKLLALHKSLHLLSKSQTEGSPLDTSSELHVYPEDNLDEIRNAFNLTPSPESQLKYETDLMVPDHVDSSYTTLITDKTRTNQPLEITEANNEDSIEDEGLVKPAVADDEQQKFDCSLCGLTLSSSFKLKQHKVINHYYPRTNRHVSFYQHIIENRKRPRSYSCRACNKSFELQSTLLWHMRSHYSKKYSCKLCRRTFKNKDSLINHGKNAHTFSEVPETKLDITVSDTDPGSKEDTTEHMEYDDGDELGHSNGEDGLQIDEGNENAANTSDRFSSNKNAQGVYRKCHKWKKPVVKKSTSNSESAASASKKQQRKKVFGCGLCKKSYFKLMKLTKHVWEHEQLEGQGKGSVETTKRELVSTETVESGKEAKLANESKHDREEDNKETKSEGKYMCSLCKIKYQDSADLFKHAKIHLALDDIILMARRKQKYAQTVTGDPSKPAVYIELDEKGNLVHRIPAAADIAKVKEEGKGTSADNTEGVGDVEKQELSTIVVCNICQQTVYSGSNDTGTGIGSHNCTGGSGSKD